MVDHASRPVWIVVAALVLVAAMASSALPGAQAHAQQPADHEPEEAGLDAARWAPGAVIHFRIDTSNAPEGAVDAVLAAVETWSVTGIDVEFAFDGPLDQQPPPHGPDGVNVIAWVATPVTGTDFIARTTTYARPEAPTTIVGFDLVFNLDHRFVTGAVDGAWDLETIALHELGHVLGLGHSDADRVLQVMRPRLEAGEIDRTLTHADRRALARHYSSVVIADHGMFLPADMPSADAGAEWDKSAATPSPSGGLFG